MSMRRAHLRLQPFISNSVVYNQHDRNLPLIHVLTHEALRPVFPAPILRLPSSPRMAALAGHEQVCHHHWPSR